MTDPITAQQLTQAEQLLASGQRSEAYTIAKQITTADPLNAHAWYLLSQATEDAQEAAIAREREAQAKPIYNQRLNAGQFQSSVQPQKKSWKARAKWIAIGTTVFLCSCLSLAYRQGSQRSAEQTAIVANGGGTNRPVLTDRPMATEDIPQTGIAGLGESRQVGQWEISILDVYNVTDFKEVAQGQWVLVHGTITNQGNTHRIGQEEIKLRTTTKTYELNRPATLEASNRLNVSNIGSFGGKKLEKGDRDEWAIVFDIPKDSEELWITLEGEDLLSLGRKSDLKGLPTLTPTRTPLPTKTPTITPTPRPTLTPSITPIPEPTDIPTITPSPAPTKDIATKEGAIDVCKQAVTQRLTHPSTADFPWFDYGAYQESDLTWIIQSTVTAKNSFGLELKFVWVCQVTYTGNNRWDIDDVQIAEQQ